MSLRLFRIYRFIEPVLKVIVRLLVNRTTFALLELVAGFHMFLLLCMAFIFYLHDRSDASVAFVGFVFLVNFSIRFLGRNLWKIELWSKNNTFKINRIKDNIVSNAAIN